MKMLGLSYGLALLLRVVTLAVAALGIVIQRKSHVINDAKPHSQQKNALKRPLWHLGFWLYLSSSVLSDVVGITSLPLLVIALVGTLLLFFNAVFSHFILQENMTKKGWFGMLLVAISSCGLAILLNLPNDPKAVDELKKLVSTPVYIIYSTLTLIILLSISVFVRYVIKARNVLKCTIIEQQHGVLDGGNDPFVSLNEMQSRFQKLNFLIALCYQCLSTILAGLALVFAKISFELLQQSITTGKNQFKNSLSISFLIVTIITTILQLVFFNFSLHYYPTLFTIPFGYSLGIILACLNTLVYYNSFFVLQAWESVLVVVCVVITIFGIYLLSK